MCYCETLAKENDDSKTGFKYQIIANYDEFDPEKVAIESAKEAISQLLAEPVKSKKYKILLKFNRFQKYYNLVFWLFFKGFGSII